MIAPKRGRDKGFTLVEILLAVFIFSIIITTLFSSYSAVLSKMDILKENNRTYESVSRCLERFAADLESVYIPLPPIYHAPEFSDQPSPHRLVGDHKDAGTQSFSRLRFSSTAHVHFGADRQEGIAQIAYYVDMDENEELVLRRSDSLPPYPEVEASRKDPVLCERIKRFEIAYYNVDGQEFEYWDSESKNFNNASPVSIRISLEIGDESNSHFFQTMIALPTNRKPLE